MEQPINQASDLLKQQILLQQAKVKSPFLAALLGFFFPMIGYLYVRRYGLAILILFGDIMMFVVSLIGIGIPFLIIYHVVNSYTCHKTAESLNLQALQNMTSQ